MNRIKYEVYGKVQGVFFRKYTQKEAVKLRLSGWVMNTDNGTVVGVAEGPDQDIMKFKRFLENQGSPKSRIDKLQFEITDINKLSFQKFSIRR